MVDINCADTVLCNQSFRITGPLIFNIRNENENSLENMSNINAVKSIFTKSIEYSIEKVKNSKNDILIKNEKREEISNIKPYNDSRETTMILPDNSA